MRLQGPQHSQHQQLLLLLLRVLLLLLLMMLMMVLLLQEVCECAWDMRQQPRQQPARMRQAVTAEA
jgi:hypothetical protein